MTFKPVMRYDPILRWVRLFRLIWNTGVVGDGQGYSSKLTVALTPRLFRWDRGWHAWTLTILFVRIHYVRSYGGRFV